MPFDNETIAEVQRRSPYARTVPTDYGMFVVANRTEHFGSPSDNLDDAWDMALRVLLQRDRDRGRRLVVHHAFQAVYEYEKCIDSKRTTLDDVALVLKQEIHAAMTKFMDNFVAVDVEGLE